MIITGKDNKITAEILPDFGGLLTSLKVGSREIFYTDEKLIKAHETRGGGNPILFPICGTLKNNQYEYEGETYHMNPHGFAKVLRWKVDKSVEADDFLRIYCEQNADTMEMYPFEFRLEMEFSFTEHGIMINQRVNNLSDKDMPFFSGYHPFFAVEDISRTRIKLQGEKYHHFETDEILPLNYVDGYIDVDITLNIDDVFYGIKGSECIIDMADEGTIVLKFDDCIKNFVIWREKDAKLICVEPWIACPDALNSNKKDIIIVGAKDCFEYKFSIEYVE